MKIVALNGSPRKNGNTAKLLKQMVQGFDQVNYIDLYPLNIKGCSGCLYCKGHEGCSIKDDMTRIFEAIEEADVLIIGSPIYMGEETASTKAFAERLYACLNNEGKERPIYTPKLKKGKKGVAFFPCGNPFGKRSFKTVKKNYEKHFKTQGFEDWRVFIAPGIHPGVDALQDPKAQKIIAQVRKFLGSSD